MRIAHLDTGREWRGGQAQVLFLMRGLRARGHESVLLAPRAPLAERARQEGFETVAWRPHLEWDPLAILQGARVLRGRRVELVHAHTARAHGSGAVAGRLAGVPVVVSRRVPLPIGRHGSSRLKYRHGVERYLCVSHSVAEALRAGGVAERRIAIVPSGVDLDPAGTEPGPGVLHESVALHDRVGAPAGAPLVGTLGSLTSEKGHEVLLEAVPGVLARVPAARFVWIGEGDRRAALAERCRRLGLEDRVHLLGFRADAPRLLRQLTLLVVPSRFEGLGNAVLEAQAAGVPVVATAVGGIPEVIQDGINGRLVPAGDPAALAAAIVDALGDREARARWAERARSTVREFGVERMVDLTVAQYRAVLAVRSGDRRED